MVNAHALWREHLFCKIMTDKPQFAWANEDGKYKP